MSSENYTIKDQNAVYFLTFTITDWVDVFTRYSYKKIIVESLEYCRKNKGLKLYAWVLMSNHIHLVCAIDAGCRMTDFIRDFKHFTATSILDEIINNPGESRRDWMLYRFEFAGKYDNRIKQYRFWQDKSHPVELSTTEMIDQRIKYIHENPVRTGLVGAAEDYLFSSARNYAGLSAVIEIDNI